MRFMTSVMIVAGILTMAQDYGLIQNVIGGVAVLIGMDLRFE